MINFNEFVDHKDRACRRHLNLIKKILESAKPSFKIKPFLDEENPYIFVHSPDDNFTFEGIRIYPIGSTYAYKIQNAEDTHPFGKAYSLDIEKMFSDQMGENISPDEAAKRVADDVRRELRRFFKKSTEAEQDMAGSKVDNSNSYVLKTGGTDYSSLVFNKM